MSTILGPDGNSSDNFESNGFDADRLAAVAGGAWVRRPAEGTRLAGASIDTRTLSAGNLFFALRGERVDGHDYLGAAEEAGAGAAVVERDVDSGIEATGGMGVLRVASTRAAMAALAKAYRADLRESSETGTRVIGVTGSNGKTTTVRLIDAALRGGGLRGTHAQKSLNNELGVPLTILNASPGDDYLVCEVGTNAPGEIGTLAAIVAPDIAVVTSIGRAHLEKLGSVAGIADEKADLVRGVADGGVAIVTGDSAELDGALGRGVACRVVRVGRGAGPASPDFVVGGYEAVGGGCVFTVDGRTVSLPLPGVHNACNAAIAYAVAREMGCEPGGAVDGLSRVAPPAMRLEIVDLSLENGEGAAGGQVRIVNDAYNANPESVRAALAMLADGEFDPGVSARPRRVAVLGDMLELGDASEAAHREIATLVAGDAEIAVGLLVGERFERAASAAQNASGLVALGGGGGWIERVAGELRPGDVVLLKGSRGMRLERLIDAMRRSTEKTDAGASR